MTNNEHVSIYLKFKTIYLKKNYANFHCQSKYSKLRNSLIAVVAEMLHSRALINKEISKIYSHVALTLWVIVYIKVAKMDILEWWCK